MADVMREESLLRSFFSDTFGAEIITLRPHDIASGPLTGHFIFEAETDFDGGSSFWVFTAPELAAYPQSGMLPQEALTFHLANFQEDAPRPEAIEPAWCGERSEVEINQRAFVPAIETQEVFPAVPALPSLYPTLIPEKDPKPVDKFMIGGADLQYLQITLAPGDRVVAEPGAFLIMTTGVEMKTMAMDDLAENRSTGQRILQPLKRLVTGERFFVAVFQNKSQTDQTVLFTPPHPGGIVTLPMHSLGEVTCHRGSFLCGLGDVGVTPGMAKRLAAGLFSGEGLLLQKLFGSGQAFISGGGNMICQSIPPGGTLRIESGSLMAWQSSLAFDIALNKGYNLFAGEGLFLTTLVNQTDQPAKAWIQTVPFQRLAQKIHSLAPRPQKG